MKPYLYPATVLLVALVFSGFTSPHAASARPAASALAAGAPVAAAVDSDGDGLSDSVELALGTDPQNVDSDCDYVDDGSEVGTAAAASDGDGDGIINALESALVDSDGDATDDQADRQVGPQTSCGHFVPFAIANGGLDTTRLEVRVAGGAATAVRVDLTGVTTFLVSLDGAALPLGGSITLYDDGSHGDRLAGDGLWSRNGFTSTLAFAPGARATFSLSRIIVTTGAGDTSINRSAVFLSGPSSISLGIVDKSNVLTPTPISSWAQQTSHLVNLIAPLTMLDVQAERNRLLGPSQLFYNYLGDDPDFLNFFSESTAANGVIGEFFGVRNDVQNIGSDLYNDAASYRSAGQLQGVIFMNFGTNGPSLHEIMHRWGAFGMRDLGIGQCTDQAHWGVAGVGHGQLGGFDPASLVDNGNGTYTVDSFGVFANGGDSVPYNQLERYLAGFLDASGVTNPIKVPQNVDCNSLDYSVAGKVTFAATGISTVSMAQIQTSLGGARSPAFASSQKSFKARFAVVSQRQLDGAEMTYYDAWANIFGSATGASGLQSFQSGSAGVATMDTTVSPLRTNQAPAASDGALAAPGAAASGSLSASDADSDVLTYSIVTDPAKGALRLVNPRSGSFIYTPAAGASGSDSFTFRASDGRTASNTATVNITLSAVVRNNKAYLPLIAR